MEINYLINYIKINKAAEIAFGRAVTTLPYLRNISVIIFGISTQAGWLPNTSGRGLASLRDRLLVKRPLRRKRYIVRHINIER